MKLGAQLFSLRTFIQTPEDLKTTFLRVKEIGYENVQLSGNAPMSAEDILAASEAAGLPIVCTHSPLDRIINDTDALIADHKHFGCPVIGLGALPKEAHGSIARANEFFKSVEAPVAKILDAGLNFAYHNHAFEFEALPDGEGCVFDLMIERCPTWHFILDTGWVQYAGRSAVEYIERIGGERLQNIHFKEFKCADTKTICPCGEGFSDFASIVAACEKVGVTNALVEQDNACTKEDPFGEMERSAKHLLPLIKA